MTPERRREIFNRVVDRWATQGSAFESHPVFLAKVGDWIEGQPRLSWDHSLAS